jgi:hypothetical protein
MSAPGNSELGLVFDFHPFELCFCIGHVLTPMNKGSEKFSPEEARKRMEAALRGARLVGHKPQSEMKLGKSSGKPIQSPIRRSKKKPSK